MTTRQAELINQMCLLTHNTTIYNNTYQELLKTCSDALVQPTVTVTTGTAPTVTGTTGTTPPPPSTLNPMGPDWWRERNTEALQEQISIITDKNMKIITLENQIELLMKRIKEDKEHWEKKAVIDDGVRKHNHELVAANGEIYEALRKCGFEWPDKCSLVERVKRVIKMCEERGKRYCEKQDKIDRLNDLLDSQTKVIEKLSEQRKP